MTATELVVWGTIVHLVVDWLFQNEWIATNKCDITHPAGYVHASAHAAALLLVFPPVAAVALGVAHFVIDTRHPLKLWERVMSQTQEGPVAMPVHIWRDQTLHIAVVAIAALIVAS